MHKNNFDLIFHLIPHENNILRDKLTNKFGTIINTSDRWHSFHKVHHARTISNQYANVHNIDSTQKCVEEILEITRKSNAKRIAINIDYDNIRHYLHLKETFIDVFTSKNINMTFFLNKIIEIVERDDMNTILELYHNSLLGGHAGRDKLYKTISKFYKWEGMREDIANFVKKCLTCKKTKTTVNTRMPMEISTLGEQLFDNVYIDFVGPIATSAEGHKYIFTAICDLTKFLVAVPTKDCTALTAAECLLEHILCRYSFPARLISDNATSFTSQIIKELCKLCVIKKIFTSPYHPQANMVERAHRTLNSYMRAYTANNRDTWHEILKYATFAYNNAVHTNTGFTPHELAHGFRIKIPTHLNKPKIIYNYDNYADITRNRIADTLQLAKTHLYNKKWENKRYYDKKINEVEFKINDLVLIKNQSKNHKFDDTYEGPFPIVELRDSYVEIMKGTRRTKGYRT